MTMQKMALKYTRFSPFARKVLVLSHERQLFKCLELEEVNVGTHVPLATPVHDELAIVAPLMKIPVLEISGESLYDSRVICEYLDSLHNQERVFPAEPVSRWAALRQQALGDGITDALILCRFEEQRDSDMQSERWTRAQLRRVTQALNALERDAANLASPLTIGHIAIACAIGYLEFRFAHVEWKTTHPRLWDWYSAFADRPSMRLTQPS